MIISNIISNAYKHTPKWWTIKISLSLDDIKSTHWILTIHDNGKWISSQDIELIWDRFWKWGSSNGYGLWLFIVKLLCEKMWYEVYIDSTNNIWAKFVIKWTI